MNMAFNMHYLIIKNMITGYQNINIEKGNCKMCVVIINVEYIGTILSTIKVFL